MIRVRDCEHRVRDLLRHLGAVGVSPGDHEDRLCPVRARDRGVPRRGFDKPVPQIRVDRPLGAVAENHGVPKFFLRLAPDEAVCAVVLDRVGRDRVRTEIAFEIVPVETRPADRDEIRAAGDLRVRSGEKLPHKAVNAVIEEEQRIPDKEQ